MYRNRQTVGKQAWRKKNNNAAFLEELSPPPRSVMVRLAHASRSICCWPCRSGRGTDRRLAERGPAEGGTRRVQTPLARAPIQVALAYRHTPPVIVFLSSLSCDIISRLMPRCSLLLYGCHITFVCSRDFEDVKDTGSYSCLTSIFWDAVSFHTFEPGITFDSLKR